MRMTKLHAFHLSIAIIDRKHIATLLSCMEASSWPSIGGIGTYFAKLLLETISTTRRCWQAYLHASLRIQANRTQKLLNDKKWPFMDGLMTLQI